MALTEDHRIDVSSFGEDYDEKFFSTNGLERLEHWLVANQGSCPVISNDLRLGPPIARPSKIVCVGLNYAKHAKESGMGIPGQPVLFFKATSSIIHQPSSLVFGYRGENPAPLPFFAPAAAPEMLNL